MTMLALAPLSAIPDNRPLRVEHDFLDFVLVRSGDDVYALEDRCSHGDIPLSEGELAGCLLECWLHGSVFDVRTGIPQTPPAASPVKTFPVTIDEVDGTPTVFVEIG
ncbi:MAG: Rieske (2Fe-2S) protein [Candidatus Nanopelagicales bacterium]